MQQKRWVAVVLKKERIVLSEVVIEDEEVDKHALHYLQLDSKIKELEKERDSFKASLRRQTGVTAKRCRNQLDNS
jgi:hypothetical protein